MDNLLAFLE